MGMIYLAQPRGNRVRSIDRLKPKDRKKPANCNNSNVKCGKHLSNFSDLKDRYERRVGDVEVRVIVTIPDNQIQECPMWSLRSSNERLYFRLHLERIGSRD